MGTKQILDINPARYASGEQYSDLLAPDVAIRTAENNVVAHGISGHLPYAVDVLGWGFHFVYVPGSFSGSWGLRSGLGDAGGTHTVTGPLPPGIQTFTESSPVSLPAVSDGNRASSGIVNMKGHHNINLSAAEGNTCLLYEIPATPDACILALGREQGVNMSFGPVVAYGDYGEKLVMPVAGTLSELVFAFNDSKNNVAWTVSVLVNGSGVLTATSGNTDADPNVFSDGGNYTHAAGDEIAFEISHTGTGINAFKTFRAVAWCKWTMS
jgi:hypothetical protein